MTCSILPREILRRHISKTRRATRLKFCIKNVFMVIMTHAKFHFNQLMLSLILASGPLSPPPPPSPRPGEQLKRPFLIGLMHSGAQHTVMSLPATTIMVLQRTLSLSATIIMMLHCTLSDRCYHNHGAPSYAIRHPLSLSGCSTVHYWYLQPL